MKRKKIFYSVPYLLNLLFKLFLIFIFSSCSEKIDKEIVSVNSSDTGKIDESLALKGRFIFTKKCMDCHSLDVNLKGPALRDVTKQRKSEWIMNMMLQPDEMIRNDSVAKKLFSEHIVKMTVKDLNQEDAKAVLEYLKSESTHSPDTDKKNK